MTPGRELALSICIEATDRGREHHPRYAKIYNAMGYAFRTQFIIDSDLGSLEQAINAYERAVDLSDQDPIFLSNLVGQRHFRM